MRIRLVGALVGGVMMSATGLAGAEPGVRVAYGPSRISVEATDLSLPELLRAIGERAGFRVVDYGPARPPLSVTVGAATLDELLSRLLRHEGHVILYRASPAGPRVETVVLRGPNGVAAPAPVVTPAPPAAAAADPQPSSVVTPAPPSTEASDPRAGVPTATVPVPVDSGVAGQPATPESPREASQPARANDPAAPSVGNLLETQALAAHGVSPAPAATSPLPADTTEALGQTIRTAVQGVHTLVDQLSTATEQLGASGAIPRR